MQDIIKKQLENIQELQMKCEEINIFLKQMPQNQQIATERYEETLEAATNVQMKQCEINQTLENAFEQYDCAYQLIESVRENFEGEKKVGKQRMLVYQEDIAEMNKIGETTLLKLQTRIDAKKLLYERAKNNLNKFNCDEEIKTLANLENQIKDLKQKKDELNGTLLKLQEEIKKGLENRDLLQELFAEQKNKALKSIEELNESTKKEEESLLESELQIEKLKRIKEELLENINKIRKETASEENNIASLKQDIQNKDTLIEELTEQLSKLKMELSDGRTESELEEELKMKQESVMKLVHDVQQLEEKLLSEEELQDNLQIKYNTSIENQLNKEQELNNVINFRKQLEQKINSVRAEIDSVNLTIQDNVRSFEEKQKELLNKINQLTIEDNEELSKITKLENDIKIRKEMTEKIKFEVPMKKSELLEKSKKIDEMEQEDREKEQHILEEIDKYTRLSAEIRDKTTELENHIEQVKNIKSEISKWREATELCKEQLKEKCEEITNIYNKKIDAKLKEFENLKKTLSIDEDKYNDEKSKIDFQYYSLKNKHRGIVNRHNYLASIISRCKGEWVITNSYLDWATRKASLLLPKQKAENQEVIEEADGTVVEGKSQTATAKQLVGNDESGPSDQSGSLDIPFEGITSPDAVTSTSAVNTKATSKSSQSAGEATGRRKKELFFHTDNILPTPVKRYPGRKRKSEPKTLRKTSNKKTILDIVIESDSS
ncbi:hypothetical protein O3M35_000513 [Rhynocoris fuscipes]|uniref:Uncharacterized protein n=1 Tax=Rhynocoris fuscipes TaxID=488301 RepID=A0AAW1DMX8_9HEMI